MTEIVILAVIALYGGWVIRRKVKKIRAGQFCDCGHCDYSCKKEL